MVELSSAASACAWLQTRQEMAQILTDIRLASELFF